MGNETGSASTGKAKTVALAVGAVLLLGAGGGAFYQMKSASAKATSVAPGAVPEVNLAKVVAKVNDEAVSELEIADLMSRGVDRAVAVDRYINKVLAANLARSAYAKDAQAALKGAEREVLSQLYIAKRTDELRKSVKDEEVAEFYDKNVKAENYARYKVRFYLTQEPQDAESVFNAVKEQGKGYKDAAAKFKPLVEAKGEADGFALAAEMPMGLGQVVRAMKKGDVSRPMLLRNGLVILILDDSKVGERPAKDKVEAEIKDILVGQKLSQELSKEREAARIVLN